MKLRRMTLVVLVVAAAALGWRLLRGGHASGDPSAPVLGAPTRLESLGAEVFYLDAASIVRRGPSRVLAVRLERPVELVPHHFRREGAEGPQTIEAWARQLDAPVVFTAGQFDESLNHLGWLKAQGDWVFKAHKSQWKALLVSGPVQGEPWAGIIDLERANVSIAEHYRNVVQSMMLVDDTQRVRVRDSQRTACRTVVAQDDAGRVLVLVTEGAVTLADLARWLPGSGLGIQRAMNLDGGVEAQIAIRTPELQLAFYGQYGTGTTVFDAGAGPIRYPLPAVIAVRPIAAP